MNESLVARQEALQRQNQKLNQQVEAIEQRRQQLTSVSRPSSSSSTTSLRGVRSPSPQIGSPVRKTESVRNGDELNHESDPKTGLEIELSASIDSLGSQDLKEARRQLAKSESKEKVTRNNSAKKSQRKKHPTGGEASPQDAPRSRKKSGSVGGSPDNTGPVRDSDPQGLGLEATVRYQKARLRVLQDEADTAMAQAGQLQAAQGALKAEIENLKAENAATTKKNQQTQQLLEKQRELSVAQDDKQRILEGQLASAQARVEETQRAEKLASQQFRSKDVRLNRALEELEKLKAQLQDEKKSHDEQMVAKAEYDQVVRDNKKLDKQKGELLAAFKKQMKLIDLLKRQRIHMEAAKMLSFTEAEFSKTLELG
ncbi:Golgin sub A member 2 [Phytophthora pseudosyringae]|uniref:Golgin sub A member 2 n=1 Tax=Phytophthora pseudosyringae TaxID=221518 RepID=A0A8T1VNT3_9STRA|nr:Golgin sub A member 2 [Phytophthora pseudosyringae]